MAGTLRPERSASLAGVRVLLSAQRCEKGDLAGNLAEHGRVLREARDAGCALAVFPEMSLTGSVDPAHNPERLVRMDDAAVVALATLAGELGVAAVYGIAERGNEGAAYITQVVAHGGRVAGVQRKRHLGEGEAAFTASDRDDVFELDGVRVAIAICAESTIDRPFAYARSAGAAFVCFCAAPGLYERRTTEQRWRDGWDWWLSAGLADVQRHARQRDLWIAIATQAGSTADEDFPGLAALVNPSGEVVAQLPDRHPGTLVVSIP